jgi:hypothetical protein
MYLPFSRVMYSRFWASPSSIWSVFASHLSFFQLSSALPFPTCFGYLDQNLEKPELLETTGGTGGFVTLGVTVSVTGRVTLPVTLCVTVFITAS